VTAEISYVRSFVKEFRAGRITWPAGVAAN